MQRAEGVAAVRGPDARGPPGQVVHGIGEHTQMVLRDAVVEPGTQRVVVRRALQGGQQREPAERSDTECRLAGVGTERDRLIGRRPNPRPVPGHQVGERQPGQRVEHEHAGAAVSSAGQHPREAEAVRLVVTEVQRGVAEVGQHVGVLDLGARLDRRVQ